MRVYLAEWCPCIYESAYYTMSVHTTRRGAQAAVDAEIARRQAEARQNAQEYVDRNPRSTVEEVYHDPLRMERGNVRSIRVQR